MFFRLAFFRPIGANSAPSGTLNLDTDGRDVRAWVTGITGIPAPTLTLTQFDAATVDVTGAVGGQGRDENRWLYRAPGLGSVEVEVAAQLANGETPNWTASDTITLPASTWASLTYTASVTATDSETIEGHLQKVVTEPAHLAAYDAGQGANGIFVVTAADIASGPKVLYPGALAISQPDPGGDITLVQAPWGAGDGGTITTTYSVRIGATEVATSLPYSTTGRTPGEIVEVFAEMSDSNGTTPEFKIGEYVLAENPLGPVLSDFVIDYENNTISLASDLAATLTWRRYPPGHVFTNQAAEVLAGTGAIDGGSYAIESGANSDPVTFTDGITGPQEIWIVARVGSGPISNVVGGAVDITPSGSALTAPNIRGSSFGNFSASSGNIPLPAHEVGDLVELPIGINCAATDVAGITATGPNGEIAQIKIPLTDNGAGGSSNAVTLMYYRATAANTSGSVNVAIVQGGVKNAEQVIVSPIARFNVKEAGDPYGATATSGSPTGQTTATTAEITSTSAASRIQATFINDIGLPPGTAPTGWFMRVVHQAGPHAIQTMSRNDQTDNAGQVIAPVSVPLDASRRWTGMIWEVLPLGA